MNRRRGVVGRIAAAIAVTVLATLGAAATTHADHIDVEADIHSVGQDGGAVELQVVVRSSSGQRIQDAIVIATRSASIAGVSGTIELDRARTDELGIATLYWLERRTEAGPVTLSYAAPDDVEYESTELPNLVGVPDGQIERASAGVEIPILGVWVLIAVLAVVWGLIEYALLGTVRIAAEHRHDPSAPSEDQQEVEEVLS